MKKQTNNETDPKWRPCRSGLTLPRFQFKSGHLGFDDLDKFQKLRQEFQQIESKPCISDMLTSMG